MNRLNRALTGGFFSLCAYQTFSLWADHRFPAEPLPILDPQPGYKVLGYIGCANSTTEKIKKCDRPLFFAQNPQMSQIYALARTNLIDQILKQDDPVVLQIEIPKQVEIKKEEIWKDPKLSSVPLPVDTFISYHPAISAKTQKKHGVQFRIHHVVDYKNNQNGGGIQRCLDYVLSLF